MAVKDAAPACINPPVRLKQEAELGHRSGGGDKRRHGSRDCDVNLIHHDASAGIFVRHRESGSLSFSSGCRFSKVRLNLDL